MKQLYLNLYFGIIFGWAAVIFAGALVLFIGNVGLWITGA